jgi:hypothetical protein
LRRFGPIPFAQAEAVVDEIGKNRRMYAEFEQRAKALRSREARVREIACVGAPRTLLCVELGQAEQPAIMISAGVHGDEPAGPAALLAMLEDDALDTRFAYRIYPCTNPTGMDAGTRASIDGVDVNRTFGRGGGSPEAKAAIMSNRDRKFELAIDLHEDCDAVGFYCYEYGVGHVGKIVVAAVAAAGFPIQTVESYDLGLALPAGAVAYEHGVIRPDPHVEGELLGGLSYALLLARNAAARVLTFETPSKFPWEARLDMHRVAVCAAVGALSQGFG